MNYHTLSRAVQRLGMLLFLVALSASAAWAQPTKPQQGTLDPLLLQLYDTEVNGLPGVLFGNLATGALEVNQANKTVLIDAVAIDEDAQALADDLFALGLLHSSTNGRYVSGWLPINAIDDLGSLTKVQYARSAMSIISGGSTTSQGDEAMLTDIVRNQLGLDGGGLRVGVMSDTYNNYNGTPLTTAQDDIASGDLPPQGVLTLDDSGGPGIDEGRAMMQLIHDVAPGATLAFHTAFNGQADFANGILELAAVADAKVIVDDIIYFAEPMFQDGIVAQAVDQVKSQGVAYFSSAGNAGRDSYESDFRDSGIQGVFGGSRHDFDPGPGVDDLQTVTLGTGRTVFTLQWDEPYFSVSGPPGSGADLDIILYAMDGTYTGIGGFSLNMGTDPIEIFSIINNGPPTQYQLGIELYDGTAPGRLKYVYYEPGGSPTTIDDFPTHSSTLYGHANAEGAMAVGAAWYLNTPAFGVDPPAIEDFSAAGGTTIYYTTDGTPTTQVRNKPEIVAPDGTNTTFFSGTDSESDGFPNFFGTSAAAPHAAALAILLVQSDPSLTPDDIYTRLMTTAIDMDDPFTPGFDTGFDSGTGFGLVDGLAALSASPFLTVTSPNGGEMWTMGETETIRWGENIDDNVRIELHTSLGLERLITASTPSDGAFDWTLPEDLPERTDYRIRITSTANASLDDYSDEDFDIQEASLITVMEPNGGETWTMGTSTIITWEDNIDDDVQIELHSSQGLERTVVSSTLSDGSYAWAVPTDLAPNTDYRVRIASNVDGNLDDDSDDDFEVAQPPYVTVIGPNGGETWTLGSLQTITWDDNLPGSVRIELRAGAGLVRVIAGSTASDGSHDWTVPTDIAPASNYRVRVFSISNATIRDDSDADFEIQDGATPFVEVTAPNGGEAWTMGATRKITWDDNIDENVQIELRNTLGLVRVIVSSTASDGDYDWVLPTDLTPDTDYRVRIVSAVNATLFDDSDADFEIAEPSFVTVTAPDGGETWFRTTTHTITWDDNLADNVRIELHNTGGLVQTIASSTASDGSHDWSVPVGIALGTDYRIHVTSTANATITDQSDSDFAIADPAFIAVSSPNGGEVWLKGSAHTITWSDNIADNVRIELRKGPGLAQTITNFTASDGSYNWTVPANVTPDTDYRIRVVSTTDAGVTDDSDADFEIADPPEVTVTVPNGGETWTMGTIEPITWSDNFAANVKIELHNEGGLVQVIAGSTESDGQLDWTIPTNLTPASDYRIRVINTADAGIVDDSDADFSIEVAPFITVTAPDGGETWVMGEIEPITWSDNIADNVKIELHNTGGLVQVIAGSTPSDGSFDWTIPTNLTAAGDYRIRVVSTADAGLFDDSDADFEIETAPFITVTAPDGGETWTMGSTQTITWDDNITENVRIELRNTGGLVQTIIASTASDGSHDWTIPTNLTAAADYRIRVISTTDAGLSDDSDADFIIDPAPFITVTAPNGGETWTMGTIQTITWNDNFDEDVQIELHNTGGLVQVIDNSTPSDGSFDWTLPTNLTAGTDYRIRVVSTADAGVTDDSDADFAIEEAPSITVLAPNGGETWTMGTIQTIAWTDNIADNVVIELHDAGGLVQTIVASTPSDGAHDWAVPTNLTSSTDYRVHIVSTADAGLFDDSDADFSIEEAPIITVTSPNGGETWTMGTIQTIAWSDNIADDVRIELHNTGGLVQVITSSTASDGSHDWTIPTNLTAAADYRIRVVSTADAGLFDDSDADFDIEEAPVITVTSPDGGETWTMGSTQTITWTDNIDDNVVIELHNTGGLVETIVASTPSDGSHDWTLPTNLSAGTDHRIHVTSTADPGVTDASDADFAIEEELVPFITVTSPDGGEIWTMGSTQTITWDDNIDDNVVIELHNTGGLVETIVASTPSDGNFDWTLPTNLTAGADLRIRVISTADAGLSDDSDADFEIEAPAFVTVTAPNGGETWTTGEVETITWDDNFADNVVIELRQGPGLVETIAASTPSDGSFDWTLPNDLSAGTDYRIRVTSTTEPGVSDDSDADFEIEEAPFIIVTAPDGGEAWVKGSARVISWTDNIADNVRIELHNAGGLVQTIASTTASDGTHVWVVPTNLTAGADYRIRVISTADAGLFDDSDADFAITESPFITVTSPDGGEFWNMGSTRTITWDDNVADNVRVELRLGPSLARVITSSTPSDGSFDWAIPTDLTPGSDYRIRVFSTANATIRDDSDADFTLEEPAFITVTAPNGGETWIKGTTQTITWSDNIDDDVQIELHNAGGLVETLALTTPSDGSFDWAIPNDFTTGLDYRIHVVSTTDAGLSDATDADFAITDPPTLTVTTPDGGETWTMGSTQAITWNDNFPGNVVIELRQGPGLVQTIAASTESDGSFDWTLPNDLSPASDYRIRVAREADPGMFDDSDADFEIETAPFITVLSPNGGETWVTGTTETITWDDNIPEDVRIELHNTGGLVETLAATTPSDGSFDWTLPNDLDVAADYRVHITSTTDAGISDDSDADFSIDVPAFITVTSPDGGETWIQGTVHPITWSDNIDTDVQIELRNTGGLVEVLVNPTPSDGSYNWTIPNDLTPATDYRIRVVSTTDPGLFDDSDADFAVDVPPFITVTSPDGGETWIQAATQTITWSDNIGDDVRIELHNAGGLVETLAATTPSDGSFDWTIPNDFTPGADYRIRVVNTADPGLFDDSDADFTVSEPLFITVTSPNGGEAWTIGTVHPITWDDNIADSVRIELYDTDGLVYEIEDATPSDGSYNWVVPVGIPAQADYQVRVISRTDAGLFDQSDADFELVLAPFVRMLLPVGGETWILGSVQGIAWSDNIGADVRIELHNTGGLVQVLSASTPSDGQFVFGVPTNLAPGSDYRVRVVSTADPAVFDDSPGTFSIEEGMITVTHPNGGEVFSPGSTETVTWSDNIDGAVRIELHNAAGFVRLVVSSTPSDGTHDWVVPTDLDAGTDYRVRVYSTIDTSVEDFSDADFEIEENTGTEVTVLNPNGGESWSIGSIQTITWDDNLNENVRIQLQKGGSLDRVIVSITLSDGNYPWSVPASVTGGTDYRIRVVSTTNSGLFDESDADFTVEEAPFVTLTGPNGGETWAIGSEQTVTWNDNIDETVRIELRSGPGLSNVIAASTPSDGSHSWTVPANLVPGSTYRVRIFSLANPLLRDDSDADFTIVAGGAPFLSLTSPNGAAGEASSKHATVSDGSPGTSTPQSVEETWTVGSTQTITWSDNIDDEVRIELHNDDGVAEVIAASTSSDGSHTWTIPDHLPPGNSYRVRVASTEEATLFDDSDTRFAIAGEPFITGTSPNGSETWILGSTQTITWDDNIDDNVKIELRNEDRLVRMIAASTESDGSFEWTVPNNLTSSHAYRVRVIRVGKPGLYDDSDAAFSIIETPLVAVTHPNGGEDWTAGATQTITWDDTIDDDVKIELRDTENLVREIVDSTPSDGAYTWTLPLDLTPGVDYRVRVASLANDNLADDSDAAFSVDESVDPTPGSAGQSEVFLASRVEIDRQHNSEGDIHANNSVAFKRGMEAEHMHTGHVEAVSEVLIDARNTIVGRVSAPRVMLDAAAAVDGGVQEQAVNNQPLPILSYTAGGETVRIEQNGVRALPPGSYGPVTVGHKAVLVLSTGEYAFEKLEVKHGGILRANVENGALTVNVVGDVRFHAGSETELLPETARGTLLTFNSLKTNDAILVRDSALVRGNFVAPSGRVKLDRNIFLKGSVSAREITVREGTTFVPHTSKTEPGDSDNPTLSVELASFTATPDDQTVTLEWKTESETDNAGFAIEQAYGEEGAFEEVAFVEGAGTTNQATQYSYAIEHVAYGASRFRLKALAFDGTTSFSEEVEVEVELPGDFVMEPAYPNPFNAQATVRFTLRESQDVRLELYSVLGQRVQLLYDDTPEASVAQTVHLNATHLASGVYFVRLIGREFTNTQKVILLK